MKRRKILAIMMMMNLKIKIKNNDDNNRLFIEILMVWNVNILYTFLLIIQIVDFIYISHMVTSISILYV